MQCISSKLDEILKLENGQTVEKVIYLCLDRQYFGCFE